jgi:hypothetical protein
MLPPTSRAEPVTGDYLSGSRVMRGYEARYQLQTSAAPRGSQGKTLKSILKLIYEIIVRLPTFG